MPLPKEVSEAIETRLGPEARAKAEASAPEPQPGQRKARPGHFRAIEEPLIGELQRYLQTTPAGSYSPEQVGQMIQALGRAPEAAIIQKGGNGSSD